MIPRVWIPLFGGSVTKEDIYEYLYFLNQTCGNKKSSTARRLASLHGFYDFMVNHASRLENDPTAVVSPPKLDKVLPKYLTADQARNLLDVTRTMSEFPERDYCMTVVFCKLWHASVRARRNEPGGH